ncbi:MAG TPA: 2-amino-4-hydroxy-6-hydroxymethyldihydropteridine diphosphokinase [Gemmatimonadales bacterium]
MNRHAPADDAARPSNRRERVLVALGSNLGDRAASLAHARARLDAHHACRVVAATVPEETTPVGPADQPTYLNQMIALRTALSPLALLELLQEIELEAGRVRRERWGPRTLDCDIVAFGSRVIRHERLLVPHPELPNRDFWQRELATLDATLGDTPHEEDAVQDHGERTA